MRIIGILTEWKWANDESQDMKWFPLGDYCPPTEKSRYVKRKNEIHKDIEKVYDREDCPHITVSGIIATEPYAYGDFISTLIYKVKQPYNEYIRKIPGDYLHYDEDLKEIYLYYEIDDKQYMVHRASSTDCKLYRVYPNQLPKLIDSPKLNELIHIIDLNDNDYQGRGYMKVSNYVKCTYENICFLVDETVVYRHHPLQQLDFINKIINDTKGFKATNVQFIVTTSSLFVLTDLLKHNCLFLGNKFETIDVEQQPFGANYYDIISKCLSFKESCIGPNSKSFISNIAKSEDPIDKDYLNYFGDTLMKNYLYNQKKRLEEEKSQD